MADSHEARNRARELRRKAEEKVAAQPSSASELDFKRLLHELQVHQVELEMQNEELRQVNAESTEHRNHLLKIIENTPAGYFHLDREGRFVSVNDAWLHMHGYDSADEILGKHFSMMQVDDSSDSALAHLDELKTGVPIPHGEFCSRRKDGSFGYHIFSAHPVERMGAIVGFEWFIIDITERKQAEANQTFTQKRLEALWNISSLRNAEVRTICDHILIEIINMTDSSYGFYGVLNDKEDKLTIHSWSDGVMKECTVHDKPMAYRIEDSGLWGNAVRTRKPFVLNDYQNACENKKGLPEGHVMLTRVLSVPVFSADKIVAVAAVVNKASDYTAHDIQLLNSFLSSAHMIIDQKKMDQEKANLVQQLQQAQKIESIGQLAGGVAHDFNNMLGVILGHTEMALRKAPSSSPFISDLQEIRKAANRSAELTRQLLTFARKQVITPKVLDLNEAVAGTLKMLQRLIGENIQLSWNPATELWPVKVDPSQLDQILANLCVNSRDAISGAGKISIKTANTSWDEGAVASHPYNIVPGDYVHLCVSDDGCGMDKVTQTHIFEPFYTTKEVGSGTGLGLATVYGAVKQNHGFINIYSESGQGTVFNLYLPRTSEIVETKQAIAKAPLESGTETVLLVEDDEMLLRLLTAMLEESGYTVLAAITTDLAQTLAKAHPGPIHLLVSDMIMPAMNGMELSAILQPLRPEMKVLFLSGYTAEIISNQMVIEGEINFLQKPFSFVALTAKVREVLDAH